ncbi:hypothetical protein UFOVP571_34 [uncultured Caudovirales phage]|uniref:Uncharacterized protein n=1 Tax=uncultured Caudovirales phage TaxID=2100421 RepID=A0A6J5MZF1_9CAUD|nr:hypothetical protein UFOVP571_34 [uncultured Caudovirales phage]
MNQVLPENKIIKVLGSNQPYSLIYTTDAKEALDFNRKNKGIRQLRAMCVINQNGRVADMSCCNKAFFAKKDLKELYSKAYLKKIEQFLFNKKI